MIKGYIHSLESFGTVDGPGTRFVVFLQGCNLRCKYCHNPDTWKLNETTKNVTKQMTALEILQEYENVKEFVKGGITVTGGEPLLQLPFLIELSKELKKRKIHFCIDTSGGVYNPASKRQMQLFDELFANVDLVLLDIKHIDSEEHRKLVGIKNKRVLDFAKYLSDNKIPVWIRHVLIENITMNDKYLYQLGEFIATLENVQGIEVLPYHKMAINKYERLGMEYELKDLRATTDEEAKRAREIILYARQQTLKVKENEKI